MVSRFRLVLGTMILGLIGVHASAQTLTIGLGSEPSSLDPHFHNLGPNNAIARHVFGALVDQDDKQRLVPGLAVSWTAVDDLTWEFKLRPNVQFHDGSRFTAEDVVFTIKRAPDVPRSPSSFASYTKAIKEVRVVDPLTVRMTTTTPYPLLPNDLSTVNIISKKNGENATTEDYNSGKAAIGAGAFKVVERVPGDRIVLARHDGYWGPKAVWEKVVFKPIKSGPSRVNALLAGDVDLIEDTPTVDIEKLKKDQRIALSQGISNRVIYLHLDSDRATTPFATDKQGKPLDKNPLKDVRVRRALSIAINRPLIVERIMEGVAIPAGQLLPEGFFGVSPNIKVPAHDVEGARKLLAEAGYPNGFGLTLHTPNDRYINDEKVAQAVAQMLSRAGIDTKVEAMTGSVFFTRATKLEFSFLLVGWGSGTGESSSPLKALVGTFDTAKGWGGANRGRFSSAQVDRLLDQALATVDNAKREKLLQESTEAAMSEVGVIPLHFQVNTWAMKKGLRYQARTDEATLAMGVSRGD